jgi:hypothetical protein
VNAAIVLPSSALALTIAVLLLSVSLAPLQASGAVVWSDEFEDGNFDGWTVDTGEFAVEGGMLTVTGSLFSVISHESITNEGTWSFDMIDPDTSPLVGQVNFMASANQTLSGTAFVIGFIGNSLFLAREGSGGGVFLDEWECLEDVTPGCQHIGVTYRDNHFEVYLNGTHRISYDALVPDLDYSYFVFGGDSGSLDNIVVSDTIDVVCDNGTCTLDHLEIETTPPETTTTTTTTTTTDDTTTPPPPPPIPMEFLVIVVGVPVMLVIVAVIWRSRSS